MARKTIRNYDWYTVQQALKQQRIVTTIKLSGQETTEAIKLEG
jgi:hypothetical protein